MNKVLRYSVIGIIAAGGLYTGILNHVEAQVTTSNQQQSAYMKKVQERNNLIKKLNAENQKLYQLELTYNKITNDVNQKNTQIAALNSDITQIHNQIKTISNSIQNTHSSASTPVYASSTSGTTSKTTAARAPKVSHPSIVVSAVPPVVQSTTKASGN